MVSLTDICMKPLDKDCATQSVLQVAFFLFLFLFLFDYLLFWYAMECLKICENEFVPFLVSGNNINRTIAVP